MAIRNTFKEYERLKREQHIDTLFRTGKAFSVFPLKVIYLPVSRTAEELSPVRVGFSIPKRKFRLAPERNRIKRLLREAWRLNKNGLYEKVPSALQLHVFFIFTDLKMPNYDTVKDVVLKSIDRLAKEVAG